MKIVLPVFLALCLGVAPVFGQNVEEISAAAAEAELTEAAPSEAEYRETSALIQDGESIDSSMAAVAEEASLFGSDVPQLSVMRAFGGMGLVLCLLVGAYLGIRKFAPGYFPKMSSESKNLKVIESLGMGDRRSIALVEVGGKRFLVGSTPQQINLLTTLPEHFSLAAEGDGLNDSKGIEIREAGEERQAFRNMFDMGKKRSAKYTGNVLSEEVRRKMRRLNEALENR
jgi:flagellar biosynthetic protein FliO